jgi:hypothetical protein
MHPGHPVFNPRRPQNPTSVDPRTFRNPELQQVGHRNLEARHGLNRHRFHPSHRTGEGHHPRDRCTYCIAHLGAEIHTPMSSVLANRGIPGDNRTGHRSGQTNGCDGKGDQHLSPVVNISPGAFRS